MRRGDASKPEGDAGEHCYKLENGAEKSPPHPAIRPSRRDVKPSQRAFDDMGDSSHGKDAQQGTRRCPFLAQQYHHEILSGDGEAGKCQR